MEWRREWRFAKKFRCWVVGVRANRRSIFWMIEGDISSFLSFLRFCGGVVVRDDG